MTASLALPSDPSRLNRTDKALHEAMLRLLGNRTVDQITVRELCSEADVHPATFFRRHASKEALLEQIASDQVQRLVAITLPIDRINSRAAFVAVFDYVEKHRALWSTLLNGGAGTTMRKELLRISQELAPNMVPPGTWLPTDLATTCSVSVIADTIAWWTQQTPGAVSAQDIAGKLHRMVKSISRLNGEATAERGDID